MESTNGVGATLETYMAKMLTKILQTPIKINGADGPIASNILPPIPEEIKIPTAPARLKTPTMAPLFIFGASCPNNVVAAKKAHY